MFTTIKQYLILGLVGLVIASAGVSYALYEKQQRTQERYVSATNNLKAATRETAFWVDASQRQHAKSLQFVFATEQFAHTQDSLINAVYRTFKKENLQLKKLIQAGLITTKIDTVYNTNYKFSIPDTTIDLSDKYIKNIISFKQGALKSEIGVDDSVSIFWMDNKETIEPPKKFFISRWLQKKQHITSVEVIHSNIRVSTGKQVFILTEDNKKKKK